MLWRVEPPPRDDDRSDPRRRDLAHLRGDDLRVRRRVQAAGRVVRRREHGRAVVLDVPVRPAPVPRRRRVPRVVEDRRAVGARGLLRRRTRGKHDAGRPRAPQRGRPGFAVRSTPRGTLQRAADDAARIDRVAAYRYLIVGGGMTGDSACRGIRDHDAEGSIGLFGAESTSRTRVRRCRRDSGGARRRARSSAGRPIWASTYTAAGASSRSISTRARRPTTRATTHAYEKLLLATGGTPRRLPAATTGRHLLPHARRLPPSARSGGRRRARRRRRRRLHRIGDRGGARHERLRRHDRLSRGRDRRAPLPRGACRRSSTSTTARRA